MSPTEIKATREKLGLSQSNFALRLGLGAGNTTVSRWERGVTKPSRLALKVIKEMLIREGYYSEPE